MSRVMFFVLFVCLFNISPAQSLNNDLIKNLLQDSTPIPFISTQKQPIYYLGDSVPFKNNPENYIKSGNGLYLFPTGTGRLYKVMPDGATYHFIRLDSTSHFGYNIGAFPFSFNNNIYNLGGYGFWRINGQLRIYNKTARQWDIVKLNEEIPFLISDNSLIWYDIRDKKIYLGYYIQRNEAVKSNITETEFVYDVMVLDLVKNEWQKVGVLNPYLKNNIPITTSITHTPWGQLVSMGDKFILIDYKNNQVLTLDVNKEGYQSIQRQMSYGSCYFKDSTLFYGSNAGQDLDSINFHYSDFKPTGEPVYLRQASAFAFNYIFVFALIIILLLASSIYYFQKRFTLSINRKQPAILNDKVQEIENGFIYNKKHPFDEKELQVLMLLIESSAKGKLINIDDLNKVLGLTKKSIEIQKKQRSDTINSINKMHSLFTGNKERLIERKKAEFDGRSFEYFIAYEKLEHLKRVLNLKE